MSDYPGMHITTADQRGKEMMKQSGYADGGGIQKSRVKAMVRKALVGHEDDEHEGEHHKIKVKAGGAVEGQHAKHRPDRPHRASGGGMPTGFPAPGKERNHADGRAMGGATPKHKGKGAVNIVIKTGGDGGKEKEQMAAQQGMRVGAALGARQAAAKMAPPPMAPHPMAGPPPGAIPPGGPMAPPGGPGAAMGAPMGPPRVLAADGGTIKVRAHHRRRGGSVCEENG